MTRPPSRVAGLSAEPAQTVFAISDAEREALARRLSRIEYDPGGGEQYINAARGAMRDSLPRSIVKLLAEQKDPAKARPYLVFDNLPASEGVVSSPPALGFDASLKADTLSENLVVGFASLIGEPYSVLYEGDGVVNNVVPQKAFAQQHTSQGYAVDLEFHTEHPALKHHRGANLAPNALVVTAVRSDPQGPLTRLSDVPRALKQLSAKDLATLQRREFEVRSPERWNAYSPKVALPAKRVPLVSGEGDTLNVCAAFFPGTVRPLSSEAEAVLQRFHAALQETSVGLEVKPGRVVFINNDRAVHARDRFDAGFDRFGNGLRWVQRVCITHDLPRLARHFRAIRPRVFEPLGDEQDPPQSPQMQTHIPSAHVKRK